MHCSQYAQLNKYNVLQKKFIIKKMCHISIQQNHVHTFTKTTVTTLKTSITQQ